MQTPYNSNKCVALTSSQGSEEEREKRKIKLGYDLSFDPWPDPRQVFKTTVNHLNMTVLQACYVNCCHVTQVLHESIYADFILHQEHEFFSLFDLNSNVSTNCLLPTRVFQNILLLFPKILSKMRRKKSLVLNIEDYSVLERAAFRNAEKFLKSTLRLQYKPFRLSKVNL